MAPSSDFFRDRELAEKLLGRIRSYDGPPVSVMEVCGTHTVAIARMGLRDLLPPTVTLLSGPGCPVCVTPVKAFDEALWLAEKEGVILATYGDALRVPGTSKNLAAAKAEGCAVAPVYSATDALALARKNPGREVVFLGLGFETTSPTVAHSLTVAKKEGLKNFSVLSAHKALMPAMEALLLDPAVKIGAFLCPGHASMVLGSDAYLPVAEKFRVPCVVAGFEPVDVLAGLVMILAQAKEGRAVVENGYPRAVSAKGNLPAKELLRSAFTLVDAGWRGLGVLPLSGYEPAEEYSGFDARKKFLSGIEIASKEPAGCRCAEVLRGIIPPAECPLFGVACTPESPVGACMVSSEGACGAHYRYRGV